VVSWWFLWIKWVYIAPILYDQPYFLFRTGSTLNAWRHHKTRASHEDARCCWSGPTITNVSKLFWSEAAEKIYLRSKVMINIHQTLSSYIWGAACTSSTLLRDCRHLRAIPLYRIGVPYSDLAVRTDHMRAGEIQGSAGWHDAYYASILAATDCRLCWMTWREKNFDILRNSLQAEIISSTVLAATSRASCSGPLPRRCETVLVAGLLAAPRSEESYSPR
jgi:hypothetical protein